MTARLSFNKLKMVCVLLGFFYLNPTSAVEPIFLNNAIKSNELVPYGLHETVDDLAFLGEASAGDAIQQSIAIDSNNTVYVAHMNLEDNKAYVLKLQNNKWVSAADGDGADGQAPTIGDVSTNELRAKVQLSEDYSDTWEKPHIDNNISLVLTIGPDDLPYLAYIDFDTTLVVHRLNTVDDVSTWEKVAEKPLTKAHSLRFDIDTNGIIYALLSDYFSATNAYLSLISFDPSSASSVNDWQSVGGFTDVIAATENSWDGYKTTIDFQLSTDGTPYVLYEKAADFGTATNGTLLLKKYAQDAWQDVGIADVNSSELNSLIGANARMAALSIDQEGAPWVIAESFWNVRLSANKFDQTANEGTGAWVRVGVNPLTTVTHSQNGSENVAYGDGTQINTIFQTGAYNNHNQAPNQTRVAHDSQGTPYIIYQDYNSRNTQTKIRVARLEKEIIDDVERDVWREMTISSFALSADNVGHLYSKYLDIDFDRYDRPYVIFQDSSRTKNSRVLRAKITNSVTTPINLSVLEGENNAGSFDVEIETFTPILDNVTFTLTGTDASKFNAADWAMGRLVLTDDFAPDGARFTYPSYSIKISASNGIDTTPEIPVIVSFEASTDPDQVAARGYSFQTFNCEEPCSIEIDENQTPLFESIRSKISYFEITGDLPDGISFDTTDANARFEGKAAYTAVRGAPTNTQDTYPIQLKAYPIDGAKNDGTNEIATPVSIDLNIVINNVPMQLLAADYEQTLNENESYTYTPTFTAVKNFTFQLDETNNIGDTLNWGWLTQQHATRGTLAGAPGFDAADSYTGTVTATGYDGEEDISTFTITINQVDLAWNLSTTFTPTQIISEDVDTRISGTSTIGYVATKNIRTEGLQSFATFEPETGDVVLRPSFKDEGDYSFVLYAEGYDNEPTLVSVVNYTVKHTNAPPVALLPKLVTEGGLAISLNVLDYATDEDGDFIRFIDGIDPNSSGENYLRHTGYGELIKLENGFKYIPALNDPEKITVYYALEDNASDNHEDVTENAISTGAVDIEINQVERKRFTQNVSGGSLGQIAMFLLAFVYGIRFYKRKA
ncbi:hypothetical protein [Paraglaciecola sp. L3A3]|uniref:hypothetical protein n=1 Tax=Paraglaciecola sp. L3A3 TaxID=2686358 RepID=UPI00131E6911|nr:hypothetical protein [Paraglaciecola sp. L3A3]